MAARPAAPAAPAPVIASSASGGVITDWLQCGSCQAWLPATRQYFGRRVLLGETKVCECLACWRAGHALRVAANAAKTRGLSANPEAEHACRNCGQSWPLTPEYFRPLMASRPTRLANICRACESEARLRRAGRPHTEPAAHVTDVLAPLLTGTHFFKGLDLHHAAH